MQIPLDSSVGKCESEHLRTQRTFHNDTHHSMLLSRRIHHPALARPLIASPLLTMELFSCTPSSPKLTTYFHAVLSRHHCALSSKRLQLQHPDSNAYSATLDVQIVPAHNLPTVAISRPPLLRRVTSHCARGVEELSLRAYTHPILPYSLLAFGKVYHAFA